MISRIFIGLISLSFILVIDVQLNTFFNGPLVIAGFFIQGGFMLVKANVYNVRAMASGKVKAEVSLLVSDPDQLIRIRLFDSHDKAGAVRAFQDLLTKDAWVPLEVETYRGELQFALSYGALPKAIDNKCK